MARFEQATRLLAVLLILSGPLFIRALNVDFSNYDTAGRATAANDQLIVSIQSRLPISFSAVQDYTSASPRFCSLTFTSPVDPGMYSLMIAVGRNGAVVTNLNKFVFTAYSPNATRVCLVKASINFTTCQLTSIVTSMINQSSYSEYSALGVDPTGVKAFYFWNNWLCIQSLLAASSPVAFPLGLGPLTTFVAMAVDLRQTWGVLAGYTRFPFGSSSTNRFKPYAYHVDFTDCFSYVNVSCFKFVNTWTMEYFLSWHSNQQPSNSFALSKYNPLYALSVSINNVDGVLVGVHAVNTVFRFFLNGFTFTFIERRLRSSEAVAGFGKAVGWLDDETVAILSNNFTYDYVQWRSSSIELYPITSSNSLSTATSAYVSFPNRRQKLWAKLNNQLLDLIGAHGSGSLVFMDFGGLVHAIRPSAIDVFVYTSDSIGNSSCSIYLAPIIPCSPGTIKNQSAYGKDLFRNCFMCPEGTYKGGNRSAVTPQCIPCRPSVTFCPIGSVAELSLDVLDPHSQLQVYPQTSENDVLEDIILVNVFSVNLVAKCLIKQPMFWALVAVGVGGFFLLFMGIWKLTHKFRKQRRTMKLVFKQTDLIGEGEMWIGGVASFPIVIICVFAYRFSSEFLHQYPIESVQDSSDVCSPTLVNAKFSNTMQSLATPVSEDDQPLFDMLDKQPFTLSVTFINTNFAQSSTSVAQVFGSVIVLLPSSSIDEAGLFRVMTNLTTHTISIQMNISSDASVGALRVGLTAPSMQNDNCLVKELNFSHVFSYPGRTMTQKPVVGLELVMLVNETAPLSDGDKTQYSALWVPTYSGNYDEIFYPEDVFDLHHTDNQTVVTVQLTEASYFIHNVQEPIVKLTEVIFTNILFTTMCIELFALMFLFFKLAVLPILRAIIGLFKPREKDPSKNRRGGCSYCQPINPETLPAYNVPIQRAQLDKNPYAIRRNVSPNMSDYDGITASADLFTGSTG